MSTNTHDVLDLDELRRIPTISVPRAAAFLGISRATAYTMAREGRLPTLDLGGKRRRVKSAALLRMLEA